MSTKQLFTRVQNKYDTEANWNKATFVPLHGELIVYAPDENHREARFKIGDGKTSVVDLPFSDEALASEVAYIDQEDNDVVVTETLHSERKDNPHNVTVEQVGAVPISRTINGKPLSDNVTIGWNDIDGDGAKVEKGALVKNADAAYEKNVPANCAPYAKVNEIGGMTRKCNNLIVPIIKNGTVNGLTITVFDDGSFSIEGTATDSTFISVGTVDIPAGTYTLSGCPAGGAGDGTNANYLLYHYGIDAYDYGAGATFTVTESKSTTAVAVVYSGVTIAAKFYPMLNKGSTVLPYEPYFEGLRDAPVTAVKAVGRNLLNIEGETFADVFGLDENSWFTTTENGKRIATLESTGRYTFTSKSNHLSITNYNSTQWHWLSRLVKLRPNTTYRLQCTGISDIIVGLYSTAVGTVGTQLTIGTDGTFNSGNYPYWMISFYSTGEADVMITEGADPVEFAPYVRNTLTIPEAVRNLDGYGWGVNDTVYNYIDFEKKQFVKRVDKAILNGTESWTLYNTNMFTDVFDTVALEASPNLSDCQFTTAMSNGSVRFKVLTSGLHTVETWKAYLAENPMTVVYQLSTPKVIDISDILTTSNVLPVEAGGTVTMVNAYGYDVPNTVEFYEGANEIVGADTFVGDLVGTAARAICDANGNVISTSTYAPAGYGLGTEIENHPDGALFPPDNDCNNVAGTGWCYINEKTKNAPLPHGGSLQNIRLSENYIHQLAVYHGHPGHPMVRRIKNMGVWHEWEYINPPMTIEQEYRTTERWQGLPVYVKWLSVGWLPDNSEIKVTLNEEINEVFHIDGYAYSQSGDYSTTFAAAGTLSTSYRKSTNELTITTSFPYASQGRYGAVAFIKYIK